MMATNHPSNKHSKTLVDAMLKPPEDATKKSGADGDGGAIGVVKKNEGDCSVFSKPRQGSNTVSLLYNNTSSISEKNHGSPNESTLGTDNSGSTTSQHNNPMTLGQDDEASLNKTADALQMAPSDVNSQSSLRCDYEEKTITDFQDGEICKDKKLLHDSLADQPPQSASQENMEAALKVSKNYAEKLKDALKICEGRLDLSSKINELSLNTIKDLENHMERTYGSNSNDLQTFMNTLKLYLHQAKEYSMPLNCGKLTCLVNWINSIGVGDHIESLQQLKDGMHFIEILKKINCDRTSYNTSNDRFQVITKFLEDDYNINNLSIVLKFDRISKGDRLEVAKVTLLLLHLAVRCPNNEDFVEPIKRLDAGSQEYLKEIINHIDHPHGQGKSLNPDFAAVLYDEDGLSPILTEDPRLMPRELMPEPQMKSQEVSCSEQVKNLRHRLTNEVDLREDIEAELDEMTCDNIKKDDLINKLDVEKNSILRQYCDNVDEHQATKLELEKVEKHCTRQLQKMNKSIAEYKAVVAKHEEKETAFMENIAELTSDIRHNEEDVKRLKDELRKAKITKEDMQRTVNQSKQNMVELKAIKNKELTTSVQKWQNLEEQLVQLKDKLAEMTLLNISQSESMGMMITDRRVLDLENELSSKKICETECRDVKSQLNQAQNHIRELNTAIEQSKRQNDRLQKELATVKSEEEEVLTNLSKVTGQLELSKQQCTFLSTNLIKSQQRCDSLQNTVSTVDQQAVLRQTKIDNLQKELTAVKLEKEEVLTSLSKVTEQLELSKQQCTSLSTNLKEFQQRCDSLQNTVSTVDQQAVLLQTKIDNLQKELTAVKLEKEEALTSLSKVTEQLELSKQQCTSLSTNLKEFQQRCDSLQNTVSTVDQQAVLLQTKIDNLQKELTAVKLEKEEALTSLSKVTEQLELSKQQCTSLSTNLKEFQQRCDSLQNTVSTVDQQVVLRQTKIDNLQKELTAVKSEKEEALTSLSNVTEQLELSKQQCTSLSTNLKEFQQRCDSLQNTVSTVDQQAVLRQTKIDNLQKELTAVKLEKEEALTSLSKVTEQLELSKQQCTSLSTNLKEFQQRCDSLQNTVSTVDQQVVLRQTKIDNLQKELTAVKSEKEEALTSLSNVTEQLELSKQQCTSLSTNLKEFQQRCDSLQNTVSTVDQQAVLRQTKIDNLQKELTAVKSEKEEALTSLSNVTEQLELSKQQCTSHSTNLKEFQQRCDSLQNTVSTVDQQTVLRQTKIDNLQKELSAVRSQKVQALTILSSEDERHKKEIVELQERYYKIEAMKRGEAVKMDILKQELESAKLELTQTKEQGKGQLNLLKDKILQERTAKEQIEKELHSYKKKMEKEDQKYKAKAEKLQKDLTKTCTEANAYKSDLERQANEKLQEMKKESEKKITDLSETINVTTDEKENLYAKLQKIQTEKQDLTNQVYAEQERNALLNEEKKRLTTELENPKEYHGRKISEFPEILNAVTTNFQQASYSNNALQEHLLASAKLTNDELIALKVLLVTELTEEKNLTKNLQEELNRKTSEWEQREAGLIKANVKLQKMKKKLEKERADLKERLSPPRKGCKRKIVGIDDFKKPSKFRQLTSTAYQQTDKGGET